MEVVSNITLSPIYATIPLTEVNKKLGLILSQSKLRQQFCINQYANTPLTKTKFSTTDSKYFNINPYAKDRLAKSRVDRIDKSEAYRIILAYQQRLKVAKFLQEHKWEISYDKARKEFPYLRYNLYKNLLKSKALPSMPEIKNVQFPLAKVDNQIGVLEYSKDTNTLVLKNFALWDTRADLTFKLPEKWLLAHSNIVKICKPTIVLQNDKPVFMFAVKEEVGSPLVTNKVVAFDLGLSKPFSGVRLSETRELTPSVYTMRHKRKAELLKCELRRVVDKKKRKTALNINTENLKTQEDYLRDKIKRIHKSEDWSVAKDIVEHTKSDETIVLEQLSWAEGSAVKFRHSLVQEKILHTAKKHSRKVKKVSAKKTSHECPVCHKYVTPNKNRRSKCSNHWNNDRDYSAAVVLAQRAGSKTTPKKGKPTPKRPAKIQRRILKFNTVKRNDYTGSSPDMCMDSKAVSSIVDKKTSLGYQNPDYKCSGFG